MVQKERYQMKFLEYLKTASLKGEFRMYVMDHEMEMRYAIARGYRIPSIVKEEYVISMSGVRIKDIRLRKPVYDAAYKYYMANK